MAVIDLNRASRRAVLRTAGCAVLSLATACTRATTAPTAGSQSRPGTTAPAAPVSPTTTAISPRSPTPVSPRLRSPAFAAQGTPATDDLAADGYSWANARPLLLDRLGNRIALAQRYNGVDKYHTFVFANDDGVWRDSSLIERALERGTAAYDPVRDLLHVLWKGTSTADGIRYLRYTIARDDRGGIATIAPDEAVNLQLDRQTTGEMRYEHPLLLWCDDPAFGPNGALVAAWSARNIGEGGPGNEVRAARCVLGDAGSAGGQEADWTPVVAASTSTIGNPPQVAYTTLAANGGAGIMSPSIGRKRAGARAGDLYLAYHDGATTESPGGMWMLRRAGWSAAAGDWRGGLSDPVVLAPLELGVGSGYALKRQLGTAVVEDERGDRVFVGFPLWRGERGDTWAFAEVDGADRATVVEVYSAGGAHSYAPTGDIAYDAARRRLVVAYCTTGTQEVLVRLYDGRTAGEATVAFHAAPADTPLLVEGASGSDGMRVPLLLRDTTNTPVEPYHGWYGTLQWPSP
jgi:hypothetical protein